ncbi:hypothetical protein D6D28_05733 [Aureobasidium pullulans]|uniref:PEBP-like protein n=1 Tax=Aureobasidium pullulans TaxID=5580 RepID=A0A4S8SG89_AURPU|nr:hypothetical protein D6D28_05733 [Aureobasidium pullulans]
MSKGSSLRLYKHQISPTLPRSVPPIYRKHKSYTMKTSQFLLGVAAAAGVQLISAATPAGSSPQVPNTLGLVFANNVVQPGELIAQSVVDAAQPSVYAPNPRNRNRGLKKHKPKKDQTYLFTLVDLNLPYFALPNTTDFASLVPGIGPNRTTRLHWFEYNVHAIPPHQQLQNFSAPLADYQGPMPPQGDEAHNYVLYLFEQPEGWKPEVGAMQRYNNASDSFARMNFSVEALSEQVGRPIAANYFLTENENNTKTA